MNFFEHLLWSLLNCGNYLINNVFEFFTLSLLVWFNLFQSFVELLEVSLALAYTDLGCLSNSYTILINNLLELEQFLHPAFDVHHFVLVLMVMGNEKNVLLRSIGIFFKESCNISNFYLNLFTSFDDFVWNWVANNLVLILCTLSYPFFEFADVEHQQSKLDYFLQTMNHVVLLTVGCKVL